MTHHKHCISQFDYICHIYMICIFFIDRWLIRSVLLWTIMNIIDMDKWKKMVSQMLKWNWKFLKTKNITNSSMYLDVLIVYIYCSHAVCSFWKLRQIQFISFVCFSKLGIRRVSYWNHFAADVIFFRKPLYLKLLDELLSNWSEYSFDDPFKCKTWQVCSRFKMVSIVLHSFT